MAQSASSPIKVLIALPDEWGKTLQELFEQKGFFVLLADTKDKAVTAIQKQNPDAVVMISDWALESHKGNADGLMEFVNGKIPTVSLISKETWQNARDRWFDYLYHPPLHEYCSIPVDRQAIIFRLEYTLKAAANTTDHD